MGYDAVILNIDASAAGTFSTAPAVLRVAIQQVVRGIDNSSSWRVVVTNVGGDAAMNVRLNAFDFVSSNGDAVRPNFTNGRDPHRFSLPVAGFLAGGGGSSGIHVEIEPLPASALPVRDAATPEVVVRVRVSADGGRTVTTTEIPVLL